MQVYKVSGVPASVNLTVVTRRLCCVAQFVTVEYRDNGPHWDNYVHSTFSTVYYPLSEGIEWKN